MADIDVRVETAASGWLAHVTVRDRAETGHSVRVSRAELERYGRPGEDAASLVRRSFEFLLAREPNTSILPSFDLRVIERYFPEYPKVIRI